MRSVLRFDARGELKSPVRMDNGWLRLDGYIARTGIQTYFMPDGSMRRELRPAEEVFKADALATFAMVPITNEHPPVGLLSAETASRYACGALGEQVAQDGDKVRASMLVTDGALAQELLDGAKAEVSCGYLADLDETPGEYQGERYDAVQRNIRGNHVAIVRRGRAGPDVRVRLDAAGEVVLGVEKTTEATNMVKVVIDGVEYEVSEQASQALGKERKARTDSDAKAAKDADAVKAERDALKIKLDEAEKQRMDSSKLRAAVSARVALERAAAPILGAEVKLDAMDDLEVRKAVVGKLSPEMKLDGQSEAYVAAAFDLLVERAGREDSGLGKLGRALGDQGRKDKDEEVVDSETARRNMLKRNQEAWKTPLSATAPVRK